VANATIRVAVFDGARQPLDPGTDLLLTIRPQFSAKPVFAGFLKGNAFDLIVAVPEDGTGYAVIASAKGYEQAGLGPVKVEPQQTRDISLMLLRRKSTFHFARARWENLQSHPELLRILMGEDPDAGLVRDRYLNLMETAPQSLACLLNIVAAFEQLPMNNPARNIPAPLAYLKSVEWGSGILRDRIFCAASEALLPDVRLAAERGLFDREPLPGLFHPNATESYKQVEFGEGNLQISFHGPISGSVTNETLLRVEMDLDYYKDLAAHALLEVIPNMLSGGRRKTDARQIYVLRWMAGKSQGKDFDPLYTIV
jgi:hypothetical protein